MKRFLFLIPVLFFSSFLFSYEITDIKLNTSKNAAVNYLLENGWSIQYTDIGINAKKDLETCYDFPVYNLQLIIIDDVVMAVDVELSNTKNLNFSASDFFTFILMTFYNYKQPIDLVTTAKTGISYTNVELYRDGFKFVFTVYYSDDLDLSGGSISLRPN